MVKKRKELQVFKNLRSHTNLKLRALIFFLSFRRTCCDFPGFPDGWALETTFYFSPEGVTYGDSYIYTNPDCANPLTDMVVAYYRYGYNDIDFVGTTGDFYPTFDWDRKFSSKILQVLSPAGSNLMNAVCPTAVGDAGWVVGVYDVLNTNCGGFFQDCAPDHQELLRFRFNGNRRGSQFELTSRNTTVGSCTEATRGMTYTPCTYHNEGRYTGIFSSASAITSTVVSATVLLGALLLSQ